MSTRWHTGAIATALAVVTAGCSSPAAKPSQPSSPARPAPSTTAPASGYAALGDSYSAGDGAGDYLPGTDVSGNHCLRSRQAYAPLLDSTRGLGDLTFVACSGATTSDLLAANHQRNVSAVNGRVEPAQISAIPVHTKTVTLTIGGNDAGFSAVLANCITGRIGPITVFPRLLEKTNGCHDDTALRQAVTARLGALDGAAGAAVTGATGTPIVAVSTLLADIHARAPQAHVYLLGYPALFGAFTGSCHIGTVDVTHVPLVGTVGVGITITAADAAWLNTAAGQLNEVLQSAAAKAAATDVKATFVPVSSRFQGHRLCDSGVSWIVPVSGSADVKTRSAKLSSSALHPTASGQRDGYAAALIAAEVG